MLGECYNFTSLHSHCSNASWAIDCCKFKREMLRKPGSISRNVKVEMPFPRPEGYVEMKVNQYLLIFTAVAIMCLCSSVILGGRNPKKKLQLLQKKTLALPIVSQSMALRWERKLNPIEITLLFSEKSHYLDCSNKENTAFKISKTH